VLTLLASCSSAAPERAGPDATDRLTIAVPQDFGPLNIFTSHDEPLTELVYDKLLAPSPYVRQPQPWLATAVRQVDATNWDVQLRGGVRWQDGQPFTSADVAFTIAYFKTQAITGRWTHHVSDVPTIASAVPDGPLRIRLTCASACPELGTVTLADIPIIPEHIWRTVPGKAAKQVQTPPIAPARTGWSATARPPATASRPMPTTSPASHRSVSCGCRSSKTPPPPSPRCAPARSTPPTARCHRSWSTSSAGTTRSR
jgi:peptide/nickel transport system substrate-binding protein